MSSPKGKWSKLPVLPSCTFYFSRRACSLLTEVFLTHVIFVVVFKILLLSLQAWVSFFLLQGAFVGLITGLVISLWVGFGSQIYPPLPERTLPLPLSTAGCNISISSNLTTSTENPLTTIFSTQAAKRYESSSCAVTTACIWFEATWTSA